MPMSYGQIEWNGKTYLEKFHIIPLNGFVVGAGLTLLNNTITIPGEADFCLKALGVKKSVATNYFRFRLGSSDGTWFSKCGVGGTNDRVHDTLLFGNGSLPFLISPYIFFSKNGAINFDIEDVSAAGHTLDFAFYGSLLFEP